MIEAYIEAKSQMQYYKKLELKLRKQILERQFPSAGEGSHLYIDNQYQVKGTFRNSIAIDQDEYDLNKHLFTPAELACCTEKVSISMSKYKKLKDEDKLFIDDMVTIKPALPTLSIELIEEE